MAYLARCADCNEAVLCDICRHCQRYLCYWCFTARKHRRDDSAYDAAVKARKQTKGSRQWIQRISETHHSGG
jgi:hypothetical protein